MFAFQPVKFCDCILHGCDVIKKICSQTDGQTYKAGKVQW